MSTAVVLGASSGVGFHVAMELKLRRAYDVIGFHRGHYPEGVKYLNYQGVQTLNADAGSTPADVDLCVELLALNARPYSIGCVVHSLSGASVGESLTTSAANVEKTFNRLAHSFLYWVQELLNTNLLAQECVFIALSNPCPDFYLTNSGVIGPAKAALEAYVKNIGSLVPMSNHRAIGVRFSTVVTPALEKVMPEAIHGLKKLHMRIQPQGRMQTAAEIGELVAELTRPELKWLNGNIVDATGGAPGMLMDFAFRQAAK